MSATKPAARKTTAKKTATKPRAKASASKPKKAAKSKTVAPKKVVEVQAVAEPAEVQPQAPVVTDEQIGKRAYEIWLEKGRPYGQEQANWDQAVAELRG
ncbi:DUF2934 domain-containing protein [Algisphaera agarilytica]|uniref:DUF2934 domain-containing protein n=1 Tax=Algisphaera agarilytica TaxID=1385975 RepID=A0A7X0HBR1_9BACT|nr:DUF2934 domain-containing protein [Algisphaera agarilytica]MBB6431455.1 hypothetical protein [Algisphaera agarilytica]